MQTSNELSFILDKLAGDDKFRAHLLTDPVAALAAIGVTLRPDQVPEELCLPSKAEVAADRDELQKQLETTALMIPFLLSGALQPA